MAAGAILILTGPPGSGKTTAAARIARGQASGPLPGAPRVHLVADGFWRAIGTGGIAPWLPEAAAQNAVVIRAVARAAEAYAEGGFLVILDGIIGPWFLDAFRGLAVPVHYIVLMPDLDEAIRRCAARGGEEMSDPGQITALHRQFGDLGPLAGHRLPVAGHSAEDSVDAVLAAADSGRFRLV